MSKELLQKRTHNRERLAFRKINSNETEVIAVRYRKAGGIYNESFEYLTEELGLPYRNEAVANELQRNPKIINAFKSFRKALIKNYPEYGELLLRDSLTPVVSELFLFGDIQEDTLKTFTFSNVEWSKTPAQSEALYLKILPGADKQQVIDFLSKRENNLTDKFKETGIVAKKTKTRIGKISSFDLDFYVRLLDAFSIAKIQEAFQNKFPNEYKSEFENKKKSRLKYSLIASYLFHRFNLTNPKKKLLSEEYIKTIVEKAKKNKTQIKIGLFNKIP